MPKGVYIRKKGIKTGKPNLGKKRTKEIKLKLRLAHLGKKYKPMSKEGKEHLSKAQIGNPNNPQRKWKNKTLQERYGIEKARLVLEKLKKSAMNHRKYIKESKLENYARAMLSIGGEIQFEQNKLGLIGRPDFFIKPNICIFIDGCYWHKCFDCGYGKSPVRNNRDILVNQELSKQGYYVVRIWEHQICYFNTIIQEALGWDNLRGI